MVKPRRGTRPGSRHNRPLMLQLHFANRFETLANQLVERLGERRPGRPVFEADDFGANLTPETRAKEEELRRLGAANAR